MATIVLDAPVKEENLSSQSPVFKAEMTVIKKTAKSKKDESRNLYEKKPLTRLKRFINNIAPENQKKRRLYSQQDTVIERRRYCNRRRRGLLRTLQELLKEGRLYYEFPDDDTHSKYKLSYTVGHVTIDALKLAFQISKSNQLITFKYTSDIDLASVDTHNNSLPTADDLEFKKYLERIVNNDESIIELLENKQVNPVKNNVKKVIDLEEIKKKIIEKGLIDVKKEEKNNVNNMLASPPTPPFTKCNDGDDDDNDASSQSMEEGEI